MKKFLLSFLGSFLLLPADSFAALRYRSGTEVMTENSEAVEFQYQTFTRKLSYDEEGVELIPAEGESFSVDDWTVKYTRGIFSEFETSFLTKFRTVKSEAPNSNATNSGLESIGLEGKYVFLSDRKFKNAFELHFKKAMYTNLLYDIANPPPFDKVSLGDDGLEIGVDYLVTYFAKYWKYDFKFGYNKPSSQLSSELVYNAEAVYSLTKFFLLTGIGGIHSLKTDPYTDTPILKPLIGSGNSRLFNSINREKMYLYAGAQYAIGDFIIGLKGETILSGRSTDKGNTISLNVRWEKNEIPSTPQFVKQNYFAEGFVEKVSTSGNMVKINIGFVDKLDRGNNVDIFDINNYARGRPIATGTIIEVGPKWSIVKIDKRFNQSPIKVAYLIKAYY